MLILPITHYDEPRKKRGPKGGRDPSAARRRKSMVLGQMVYLIRLEGSPLLKVGRTRNIASRIETYESSSGTTAYCVAQFMVETEGDAVALEAHAVASMLKSYPRRRREWFEVPERAQGEVAAAILRTSPVPIKQLRGDPSDMRAKEYDIAIPLAIETARFRKYRR